MADINFYKSNFLYPDMSLITGAGTVLNIIGNNFINNYSRTPQEADKKALRSDWGCVGQDIYQVIEETDCK